MKKMKMKRFMLLASCAMLLTGCESDALWGLGGKWNQLVDWGKNLLGLNKEEKKSDDDGKGGDEKKEASISLKELPKYGFVGKTLNLDDYVELKDATSYTVALSEASKSFASLSGHVLSFKGEGKVEFTVSADKKSASGSLESIRESRLSMIEYFDGVENRYSVITLAEYQTAGTDTEEDESDDVYEWMMDDLILHDTNYILSFYGWSQDDETGEYIPGGFLRFGEESENAYTYSIVAGEQEGSEVVQLGNKVTSLFLDSYNPAFGVDFSKAKFEYDEKSKLDMYVLEDLDAQLFAEESLFIPDGTPYVDLPVTKVEFYFVDEADEGEDPSLAVEAKIYITYNDNFELIEKARLYTDEEAIGYPLLQQYCVPENEPEFEDYWNYFSPSIGLGDFFLSPSSLVGPNGLISIEYGWVDDETGEPIEIPEYWADTNFSYLPVGSSKMIMSANSIWVVDDSYNPLSGKMAVTSEGEEPVTTVYNIFPSESESGYFAEPADEGVWENGSKVFAELANRDNYAPGVIGEVEDLYHQEPGETEEDDPTDVYDGTMFSFYQGQVKGFVDALIAGDSGLYMLGALIDFYAGYGTDFYAYFYADLTINPNYATVDLVVTFPLGAGGNWQISFSSEYNPSVTSLTSQYEAYMSASVIGVAA